jgi:hypothetical protein
VYYPGYTCLLTQIIKIIAGRPAMPTIRKKRKIKDLTPKRQEASRMTMVGKDGSGSLKFHDSRPLLNFEDAVRQTLRTLMAIKQKIHLETILHLIMILYVIDQLMKDYPSVRLSQIVYKIVGEFGPINCPKDKVLTCLKVLLKGPLVEKINRTYRMKFKLIYGTADPRDHVILVLDRLKQSFRKKPKHNKIKEIPKDV